MTKAHKVVYTLGVLGLMWALKGLGATERTTEIKIYRVGNVTQTAQETYDPATGETKTTKRCNSTKGETDDC